MTALAGLLILPAPASARLYASGDIDRTIPDLGRAVSTIDVPKRGSVNDINVGVRISHSKTADLLIGLRGPNGAFWEMSSQRSVFGTNLGSGPKSCIANFMGFDDEAPTPLSAGAAPYDGSFQPDEGLDGFDNSRGRGAWKLYVFDLDQNAAGRLHCWTLDIASG